MKAKVSVQEIKLTHHKEAHRSDGPYPQILLTHLVKGRLGERAPFFVTLGGRVQAVLTSDSPALVGSDITFVVSLVFPRCQKEDANGHIVYEKNCRNGKKASSPPGASPIILALIGALTTPCHPPCQAGWQGCVALSGSFINASISQASLAVWWLPAPWYLCSAVGGRGSLSCTKYFSYMYVMDFDHVPLQFPYPVPLPLSGSSSSQYPPLSSTIELGGTQ